MRFSRSNNIVVGLVRLEHHPLCFYKILGVSPISFRIQVSQMQSFDSIPQIVREVSSYFSSNKILAATRGLMVEQNPVAGVHSVSFPIIHSGPIRKNFRTTVR